MLYINNIFAQHIASY